MSNSLPPLPEFNSAGHIPRSTEPTPLPASEFRIPHPFECPNAEELEEINADAEREAADNLLNIVALSDFVEQIHPEPAKVIHGILHKGAKLMITAGAKIGKTWTLLHLALAVASGTPWLGCETTKGKVLFINFELHNWDIHKRIQMILEATGIDPKQCLFEFCNLRGKDANYQKLIAALKLKIANGQYSMILFDPIYKMYAKGTDENAAGDVANLMNELESLALQSGAAIVFSHHHSKGNQATKEALDRGSGSGVFKREPDTIIDITEHSEEGCFTVNSTFRSFKKMQPFVVRMCFPLLLPDESLDPKSLKATNLKNEVKYTEQHIIAVLAQEWLSFKELKSKVMEESGMSRATFYRLWEEVKTDKNCKHDKNKDKYLWEKG